MRKNHLLTAALTLALLCCILLSACSDLSLTGFEILSPPKVQGVRSELMRLIREGAGGAYTPVYPSHGDYQNAVIERDLDGDGVNEAIAFCRAEDDRALVLYFRMDDLRYTAAGRAALHSAAIGRADFADLDGDGTEELILLCPDDAEHSPLSALTVVSLSDSVRQADMPAAGNELILSDLDGDGIQDLLLLSLSSPVGSASAALIGYADGALAVRTSCEMDSQITSFSNITCGKVSEGVSGVFADGCNAGEEYTTQVLYCSPADGSLVNPLFLYEGYESTRRTESIFSADVDRDGLVEFPVCSLFEYNEKEAPETVCRRLTWNNYRVGDMELVSKKTAVLCEEQGFLLNIGGSRVGSVTARRSDPDTVALWAWEYSGDEMRCTELLVTIRRTDRSAYDDADPGTVLGATAADVYTCELTPAGEARGYTADEVKSGFTPIESH